MLVYLRHTDLLSHAFQSISQRLGNREGRPKPRAHTVGTPASIRTLKRYKPGTDNMNYAIYTQADSIASIRFHHKADVPKCSDPGCVG